jgi:hypothetical protein
LESAWTVADKPLEENEREGWGGVVMSRIATAITTLITSNRATNAKREVRTEDVARGNLVYIK